MEHKDYSNLTDAEAKKLDISMNMALVHRNLFVRYLKQLGIADTEIITTLADAMDEDDFYQRLLGISAGHLSLGVLRSDMGAEEYKVLVDFARKRLGVEALFKTINIDRDTLQWLADSEDAP